MNGARGAWNLPAPRPDSGLPISDYFFMREDNSTPALPGAVSDVPCSGPRVPHSPELYPGHATELLRHTARIAEIDRAGTLPLPGPLARAFTTPEIDACGLQFRPVVHSDHLVLQQLDSPLLQNLAAAATPADQRQPVAATDEEVLELIYLLTTPPRQARAELARGRQFFRDRALEAIGDRFHTATLVRLAATARQHYLDSWATAVAYENAPDPDAAVFTMPPITPATASVGGCITSPAS